jgi:hypothetical protein
MELSVAANVKLIASLFILGLSNVNPENVASPKNLPTSAENVPEIAKSLKNTLTRRRALFYLQKGTFSANFLALVSHRENNGRQMWLLFYSVS